MEHYGSSLVMGRGPGWQRVRDAWDATVTACCRPASASLEVSLNAMRRPFSGVRARKENLPNCARKVLVQSRCVKVLNKKKQSGRADSPWRDALGFNSERRALYKPRWAKRVDGVCCERSPVLCCGSGNWFYVKAALVQSLHQLTCNVPPFLFFF